MADDVVAHFPAGHKGAFGIERDGVRVGTLAYTTAGNQMILEHTEVDPVLRGTGAGARLVAAAVEHARANKLRIIPLCPFAKSVFDRKPEYADVLSK